MATESIAQPPTSAREWSAVLDAVAHRQVRVTLLSPSGARVVLVAEEELAALEQRAQRVNLTVVLLTACLAPTLKEALNPLEDESHGGTEEVPR